MGRILNDSPNQEDLRNILTGRKGKGEIKNIGRERQIDRKRNG